MGISETIQRLKGKIREGTKTEYVKLEDLDKPRSVEYETPSIRQRIEGTKSYFKQKIAERKLYNNEKLIEQAAKETQEIKNLGRKIKLAKVQTEYSKVRIPKPNLGKRMFGGAQYPLGQLPDVEREIREETRGSIKAKPRGNIFGGRNPFDKE